MASQKKAVAAVIGTVAGIAAVTFAVAWYVKSQSDEPIKDAQTAIRKAYDKIKEIEQIATSKLTPQG